MPLSILKIFTIFGIVSTWAEKAFEDRIITLPEAVDLVERLARVLGIPTKLEIPGLPAKPPPLVEEAKEELNTEAPETTDNAAALPSWAR